MNPIFSCAAFFQFIYKLFKSETFQKEVFLYCTQPVLSVTNFFEWEVRRAVPKYIDTSWPMLSLNLVD